MLSVIELKNQDVIWDAVNDRDLVVIDPQVVDDCIECRVEGYDLKLRLSWIGSNLDYGPHWDISVITPGIESLEEWNAFSQEYDRFWNGH